MNPDRQLLCMITYLCDGPGLVVMLMICSTYLCDGPALAVMLICKRCLLIHMNNKGWYFVPLKKNEGGWKLYFWFIVFHLNVISFIIKINSYFFSEEKIPAFVIHMNQKTSFTYQHDCQSRTVTYKNK